MLSNTYKNAFNRRILWVILVVRFEPMTAICFSVLQSSRPIGFLLLVRDLKPIIEATSQQSRLLNQIYPKLRNTLN